MEETRTQPGHNPGQPGQAARDQSPSPHVWTPDAVEAALRAALDVYRRLPLGPRDRPAGYRTAWPDIPMDWYDWWNNYNTAPATLRRPRPSPAEIDAAEQIIALLREIRSRRSRQAITLCLMGWPKKVIAKKFNIDRKTLGRWKDQVFRDLAGKCNRRDIQCRIINDFRL